MKKRIISAAILVPILFLLTLAAPVIAASLVMSALMAIAAYELLYRTGLVKRPRLVIYSCIMAAAVCMWSYFGAIHSYFVILMIVFFILMFSEMMLDHIKVHFEDLCHVLCGGSSHPLHAQLPHPHSEYGSRTVCHPDSLRGGVHVRRRRLLYRPEIRAAQAGACGQPQQDHRGRAGRHCLRRGQYACFTP